MNEKEESIENKVPMGQKIAFGFGMLANQMFPRSASDIYGGPGSRLRVSSNFMGIDFFLTQVS